MRTGGPARRRRLQPLRNSRPTPPLRRKRRGFSIRRHVGGIRGTSTRAKRFWRCPPSRIRTHPLSAPAHQGPCARIQMGSSLSLRTPGTPLRLWRWARAPFTFPMSHTRLGAVRPGGRATSGVPRAAATAARSKGSPRSSQTAPLPHPTWQPR